MAALFIDSTYDITLGVLSGEGQWLSFQKYSGQKASSIIQKETHALLSQIGLRLKDIDFVATVAGPGFYTGLRLSEGFADVLTFSGIKHYSFLSYSIPRWVGVESGLWMTKAYRGEYFFHSWSSQGEKNELIASKDLEKYLLNVDKTNFYIHSESAIDDFSKNFLGHFVTSQELLKNDSKKVFDYLLKEQLKTESFYFRAPEDEFKVST